MAVKHFCPVGILMNYWENLMRVRTEEKREAIVQAASEVFLELGFEGAYE